MSNTELDLKILTYNDLRELGYGSRTKIWRDIKEGKFPKPRTKDNKPVWRRKDVEDYFNALPEHESEIHDNLRNERNGLKQA